MKEALTHLYQRDLSVLYQEIEKYPSETLLWQTVEGVINSSGNLALHLIGNLNTYFGKNLGNTGYVRNRPAEFADKDVPKAAILEKINKTKEVVLKVLQDLSPEQMDAIYPENVLGYEMTTTLFLIHLHGHLTYHLGQINYLRRIIS